ncbi:MAG: GNAT family N-acetyltransferase [Streptosporangiaceae bacterium]|jgi:acyl-CoA synthetase (NDP forming)/GNAT superfamily N-acetyltransferase
MTAPRTPAAADASAAVPALAGPDAGDGTYALLTDGSTVHIRQARPQDADAVREMHAAMSPDNIYLRFFSVSPRSADREARRVCREPDAGHAALLAWLDGRLIGLASYEPAEEAGTAEIAFAVPDDMHGRGVATLLLEHLVSLARLRGLTAFKAQALLDNAAMLRVFADAGLPAQRRMGDGVVELTFPLPRRDENDSLDGYLQSVASRESRADVASLRRILQPGSVAVIGASRHASTVGRAILHNIVTGGFAGNLYAVNPHGKSMEGLACLASVDDLPEPVDLAVIAVPPAAVAEVAAACGRKGVRALAVITAGLGAEGADLLAICRRYGMRLVGPNCFGVAVPRSGLNATFAAARPAAGVAGLVMQSGGVGIALLNHLSRLGVGVSSFASVGDKYDVSSNDMLMWWEHDGVTRLAILYVESFGSPRKFARTARRVGQRMPVLAVTAGRSAAGQRAFASRSALAAPPAPPLVSQEALFDQAGVIATSSLGELVEAAALLACQPLPAGNRVAIVSNAGGAGVLAADACGDNGLQVAKLGALTRRRLRGLLPPAAKITGPVNTTAAVGTSAFRECLEQVAADDGVDAVLAVAVNTAVSDLRAALAGAAVSKPLAVALLDQAESVRLIGADRQPHQPHPAHPTAGPAGDGGETAAPGAAELPALAGLPAYAYPEDAARALGHAVRYRSWLDRQHGEVPELAGLRIADARQLIASYLAASPRGGWLPADQAARLLSCYQVPMAATLRAGSEEEAIQAAADLGGRVALRAEVSGLACKSDADTVKLDLRTPQEVSAAYGELAAGLGSRLRQVLVQPMLSGGAEVQIGVVQEPVFGPLIVLGLGGVATEVVGDHASRLAPLTQADAEDMISELRYAPVLFGQRGVPRVDTAALADALLRVSRLADDLPEVAELELNPVVARPDGVCGVNVRVRVSAAEPRDPFLRRLR